MSASASGSIPKVVALSDDTKESVADRVQEHNDGVAAKYTRGRTPVTLVYTESFTTRSNAMSREYEIKQLTRKQKEQLITE